jgi:hypothetical protein
MLPLAPHTQTADPYSKLDILKVKHLTHLPVVMCKGEKEIKARMGYKKGKKR